MSIDELEKLYSQTTQGEWGYCYDGSSDYSVGLASDPQDKRICGVYQRNIDIRDAEFIAVAHNVLPKLIAVARAAQGMFGPKPFISYLQTQRVVQLERNKLKEALAELEKS